MKVKELIKELQKLDPELTVIVYDFTNDVENTEATELDVCRAAWWTELNKEEYGNCVHIL
jgi:hypothetical protein